MYQWTYTTADPLVGTNDSVAFPRYRNAVFHSNKVHSLYLSSQPDMFQYLYLRVRYEYTIQLCIHCIPVHMLLYHTRNDYPVFSSLPPSVIRICFCNEMSHFYCTDTSLNNKFRNQQTYVSGIVP